MALGDRLNITILIGNGDAYFKRIPEYGRRQFPGSDLLADVLRPLARMELRDDDAFDLAFGKLELAITIGFAERQSHNFDGWAPVGRFAYQGIARQLLTEWEAEAATNKNANSLRLMAGLKKEVNFDQIYKLLRMYR
jgi:hypothetical protein